MKEVYCEILIKFEMIFINIFFIELIGF